MFGRKSQLKPEMRPQRTVLRTRKTLNMPHPAPERQVRAVRIMPRVRLPARMIPSSMKVLPILPHAPPNGPGSTKARNVSPHTTMSMAHGNPAPLNTARYTNLPTSALWKIGTRRRPGWDAEEFRVSCPDSDASPEDAQAKGPDSIDARRCMNKKCFRARTAWAERYEAAAGLIWPPFADWA